MMAIYHEPELTEPVELCDQRGNLNPDAIGREEDHQARW